MEVPLRALRAGYERRRLLRRGVPFRTDVYVVGEDVIWGATARMVGDLLDRLARRPGLSQGAGPARVRPRGARRPYTSFSIGTATRLPHSVHEPS